jgi:asparagine synthase (glutamine-hydrolysing)
MASSISGMRRVLVTGVLYNRHELASGMAPREEGERVDEAQVVLRLYEERGAQGMTALRGSFAIAIWDARRSQLLLVRDQLGLMPLYVAQDGARLAASSSLGPLLRLPGVSRAWDARALDAFLTLGCVPGPLTVYPAARQVRPGELLVWEDGRLKRQRYWHLTFPERRLMRADGAGLVRQRLLESLALRQTGTMSSLLLSGGLDAAAVLVAAVAERRPPVRALTIGGEVGEREVRGAARLAARAGVEHVVLGDATDWGARVDDVLATHGGPIGGLDVALLAAALRGSEGRRSVTLSGHAGEEVLGGAPAFRAWLSVARYQRLPGFLREGAEVWARMVPHSGLASLVGLSSLAPVAFFARQSSLFSPVQRAELYTEDALALVGEHSDEEMLAGLFADAMAAGAANPLDAIHHVALHVRLPQLTALHADAAARGVDLRFPFADHRLAQVVASMPPERRGTPTQRQLLLRRALAGTLPTTIARQPHRPLTPPASAWANGPLRDVVEETLSPARVHAQGLFRPETVARLRAEHVGGAYDHGARLWALILATRWLDRLGWAAAAWAERAVG